MGNSHGTVFHMELTNFIVDNDKTKIMSCPVVDKQPSSTDEAKDEAKDEDFEDFEDFEAFYKGVHKNWGNLDW